MVTSNGQGKRRRVSAIDTDSKRIKRGDNKMAEQHKLALAVLEQKGWCIQATGDACILSPGPTATILAPKDMPGLFPSQIEVLIYAMGDGGLVTEEEIQAMEEWKNAEERLLETRDLLVPTHESNAYIDVRKEQLGRLVAFLIDKMDKEEGGFIHLCGMPGTGKSLCSNQAISRLQEHMDQQEGSVRPKVVRINCTHHVVPGEVFKAILEGINHKDADNPLTPDDAESLLAARMSLRRRNQAMTIVVLDEMDRLQLETDAGKRVLRGLLEIALESSSSMVIVGISNTLDQRLEPIIPEQHRSSDPNKYQMTFPAYNSQQLELMLNTRLGDRFHVSPTTPLTTMNANDGR